jgi:hypothetical protein
MLDISLHGMYTMTKRYVIFFTFFFPIASTETDFLACSTKRKKAFMTQIKKLLFYCTENFPVYQRNCADKPTFSALFCPD